MNQVTHPAPTTGDPFAVWNRQIRESGKLELYPARWPWALMVLAAAMAALAGLGMYGDAGDNDVQRALGVLFMIGGIIGIPMAIRTFMRAKRPIVIDEVGIQLPSRPLIPWYEVRGTDLYVNRSARMVMIKVSEDFLGRFHSATNPMVRVIAMIDKGVSRTPAIYLPTTLKVNKVAFAVWLARAAGVRPPFDLDR